MPVNLLSQKNILLFVGAFLVIVLGGGYFFFSSFITTGDGSSNKEINKGLLSKNVLSFINSKGTIDLKDSAFVKSVLYSELQDYSENITMSSTRGRDNPFIPYVAPRSIR